MNQKELEDSVLFYYVGGKVRNPEHDERIIDMLLCTGLLRSGVTPKFEQTLKATELGLIHLRAFGYDVEAPRVVNGRIVRDDNARGTTESDEVLFYYVGGKVRNPEHDERIIDMLLCTGLLRSGVTLKLERTLKTTRHGLVYLRTSGYDVEDSGRTSARTSKNRIWRGSA